MKITIPRDVLEAWPVSTRNLFGLEISYAKHYEIDLRRFSKHSSLLLTTLAPFAGVRGVKSAMKDVQLWEVAKASKGEAKVQSLKSFAPVLTEYMRAAPHHHLYEKDEGSVRGDSVAWRVYFVDNIEYHPPEKHGGGREGPVWYTPAYVSMTGHYLSIQDHASHSWSFYTEEVIGKTTSQILANDGLYIETPEKREQYLKDKEYFLSTFEAIGKQFYAEGKATELSSRSSRDSQWWHRETTQVSLTRDGQNSKVVIDVLSEGKDDEENALPSWKSKFWDSGEISDEGNEDEEDDGDEETPPVEEAPTDVQEIPFYPLLRVFDLKRHMRLQLHISQLTEYIYDSNLGSKLILPKENKSLIEMLLQHKGGFEDIVGNKGGGAIILCCGIPGTGKTLSAEVFSESAHKPLYSVQTSQLGTSPDELETELLKIFARAQRWGAILLIDEADVYVAARGRDLTQNAIVGVFLRVLEYYSGVLFLTTNRADLVDDAIASRCVARIDYGMPTPEDLRRIWAVLAETMGVKISPEEIEKVAVNQTGRDVKNLLKLAKLVSSATGAPVTADTIAFVKRFKPTGEAETEEVRLAPGNFGNGEQTVRVLKKRAIT